MGIKIEETYHVVSCCCPSFIVKWQTQALIDPKQVQFFSKFTVRLQTWEYFPAFYPSWCACMIGSWGRMDFRGCSWTVSFVFEQSGANDNTWRLIILVTRRPKLSAILNCAGYDRNSFRLLF